MILDIFLYSFPISVLLIIWFDTHAFFEYIKLFHLEKFFGISEYEEKQSKLGMYLHEFLISKDNNFIFRLISCPICLSVWINIILSVTCYKSAILFFGVQYVSLFLYFLFKKLIS